jgi:hypothetical protein
VDKQGNVFMVDICETRKVRWHLYCKIKRQLNQLFMTNHIKKIKKNIFQNELTSG